MSEQLGLRERKKQQTRQLISDIATGLFLQRGFDNVTVAEIAVAANVSKMTVFNYFPRKEDLYFDRQQENESLLAEAITTRTVGQSVIDAVRRHMVRLIEQRHPLSAIVDGVHYFWAVVEASPALQARAREMHESLEDTLAALFAQETGTDVDHPRTRMAASMTGAAYRTVHREAIRRLRDGAAAADIVDDQIALVNSTFAMLDKGIGDYGVRAS